MKNIYTSIILSILYITAIKLANSNLLEINQDLTIGSISSNQLNNESENAEIFKDSKHILTVSTTGYLSISTLNRIISYPFSEKNLSLKIFYKNGYLLIKDQNNLTIWNYKFGQENVNEVEFLTFINRGTFIAQDAKNNRIWPFGKENLYKKLNLNISNSFIYITDENKNKIWSYSSIKDSKHSLHFLEDVELVKL